MKFRKKPVVIEAMQYKGVFTSFSEHEAFYDWFAPNVGGHEKICFDRTVGPQRLIIPTLEGNMTALPGDWIIKGVKGELYPCKPDIFEQTYEAVS